MNRQIRADYDIVLGSVTAAQVDATVIVAGGENTFTGKQSMGNHRLTNVGAPQADTDAARLVDIIEKGRKLSVRAATVASLPSCVAAGSGVGKTLIAVSVGVLVIDGVTLATGDRVLVQNQANAADNGFYLVTSAGSAASTFVLTRATDADTSAKMVYGSSTVASAGTVNENRGFMLITDDPIVLDTTPLVFTQSSGAGQITAGVGLLKIGDTISIVSGNGGIVVTEDAITFTADVVGGSNLAKAVNISETGVAIKIDDITVEEDPATGRLRLKALGITSDLISASVAGASIGGGNGTPLFVDWVVDEFYATDDDETFILSHVPVANSIEVFLRRQNQFADEYSVVGTNLTFGVGHQFAEDRVRVRYCK